MTGLIPPESIVVGFDGTDHAWHAMEWAVHLGRSLGVPVTALHMWTFTPPTFTYGLVATLTEGDVEQGATSLAQEAVKPWLTDRSVDVSAHAVKGGWREFVDLASPAWLIVLGSRHARLLQGVAPSFAAKSLAHAKTATLIVPQPAELLTDPLGYVAPVSRLDAPVRG